MVYQDSEEEEDYSSSEENNISEEDTSSSEESVSNKEKKRFIRKSSVRISSKRKKGPLKSKGKPKKVKISYDDMDRAVERGNSPKMDLLMMVL